MKKVILFIVEKFQLNPHSKNKLDQKYTVEIKNINELENSILNNPKYHIIVTEKHLKDKINTDKTLYTLNEFFPKFLQKIYIPIDNQELPDEIKDINISLKG